MSVLESSRGRRLDISLPPPGTLPELEEVREAYRKLNDDRKVTATRLGGLRGDLTRTIDAERDAFAKALREGKPEPKASKVEKIEKEIKACERRLAAIEEAIDEVVGDLIVVCDEHREQWSQEIVEQVATAQAAYGEAVEALSASVQTVLAKIALLRFVRLFPEDEVSYRERGSFVLGLRAPNGDPYSIYDVLGALSEDSKIEYDPRALVPRDPLSAAVQARHEERRANEEKGLGYLTDVEVAQGGVT